LTQRWVTICSLGESMLHLGLRLRFIPILRFAEVTLKTWVYGYHQVKWQMTFLKHRRIFQQLRNHFQAHLTRKSKLLVFRNIHFYKTHFPWEARRVTPAKMAKISFTVQPRLAMSHSRRLNLFYRRILSWETVTKLARPSEKMALEIRCSTTAQILHHTWGTCCHFGSNPLYSTNAKLYAYFHRTVRHNASKKSVTDRIMLICVF